MFMPLAILNVSATKLKKLSSFLVIQVTKFSNIKSNITT